ncbi:transporter substrate-binding domain-containing protein [Peptostreptococcus canis]|uniref:Transporter substrate-binding domain-containing protein n=1 Tax=Peptostreptococcus canis TaxID=1159213 RepID=A0ABR6TIZ4_9FIRM|nr:transporter substrate-binding domain-containing protein [Peptostreptococcus canis]MBC2575359.1 transporter substrate-binding domain-containing protein [Peptostreptococcus canis]MBP1997458.1 polar amino acid transport system substrate-binding protein [Peptostreptococcus canis]
MKKGLKKLMALGLVAVLAAGMVGCGKKTDSKKTSENTSKLQEIKDSGKLVVGTSPDYPPFEFLVAGKGSGDIVGADIELAKRIAKEAGVELEIKGMDFDTLIPALTSGQVDIVITGMTPDETRKKSVDFTDIYFKGKNGVIVKSKDVDKIKSEDDLKKLKLGVQKGSTQETYVKDQLKMSDYKALVSVPDLVMDMKNENIDAIILNDKVANINSEKYKGIKVVKNIEFTSGGDEEAMAIAVKKGNNKEFIDMMNNLIKKLNETKEYDKILADAVDLVSKQEEK